MDQCLSQRDSGVVGSCTSLSEFLFEIRGTEVAQQPVEEDSSASGYVMATKKPWVSKDVNKEELISPEGRRLAQNMVYKGQLLLLCWPMIER